MKIIEITAARCSGSRDRINDCAAGVNDFAGGCQGLPEGWTAYPRVNVIVAYGITRCDKTACSGQRACSCGSRVYCTTYYNIDDTSLRHKDFSNDFHSKRFILKPDR